MKALRCFALVLAILLLTVGCATGNATDIDTNAQYMGSEDCGESQIETDTSATETQAPDVSYTIIYPEGCERFIKDLAAAVRDDINKNTEKRLIYKSDKTEATPFEIIIGNTSREESEFGLENAGNDGWWVSVLNDTIVVNGASRTGLQKAVAHFIENYTVDNDGIVRVPQEAQTVQRIDNGAYELGLKLRVGTYNIKHGEDVGLDMSVLAEDVRSLELDIVGLQEVDVGTARSGGIDEAKEIAERAGYEYYRFCKAIDFNGGEYGTAILSRYPIKSFEVIPLYSEEGLEKRSVGHAVIDVNGTEIDYFNTHLSYEKTSVVKKQFEELAEITKDKSYFILTADFNTEYASLYSMIEDSVRVNHGKYITYPDGFSSIDDIVVQNGWGVNESNCVSGHSDHKILWAELRYNGGMKK